MTLNQLSTKCNSWPRLKNLGNHSSEDLWGKQSVFSSNRQREGEGVSKEKKVMTWPGPHCEWFPTSCLFQPTPSPVDDPGTLFSRE